MSTKDTAAGMFVDALARRARADEGVPKPVAEEAAAAAKRRLSGEVDVSSRRGRERMATYFWAIVRRRALAGVSGTAAYRARCLAVTLAADIAAAGHAPERIREEVARAVGAEHTDDSMGCLGVQVVC